MNVMANHNDAVQDYISGFIFTV